MNPDLEDKEKLNPSVNPSQAASDRMFNEMTDTPDMKALKDQADSNSRDGFKYTGDEDRDGIREAEEAGASSDSQAATQEGSRVASAAGDDDDWQTNVGGKSKPKGLLGRLRGLKGNKKKVVVASGALGGGSIIIVIGILLMLLSSGLGIKQLAYVLRTASFSYIHLANYQRTAQYFTEEALNNAAVSGEGRLNSFGKRSVAERLSGYDANKIFTNLGEQDLVKFNFADKTSKGWFRTTTTSELKGITIGSKSVLVPSATDAKSTRAFINEIDGAIQESRLFAQESRWIRTKTANYMIEQSGIKLSRWQNAGRKIKTFKDGVLSAYEYMKGVTKKAGLKTTLEPVEEISGDFEEKLPAALEKPGALANGAGVTSAEQMAESIAAKSQGFKSMARKASLAAMFATLYCGAVDYIGQQPQMTEAKVLNAKATAELGQTAVSQYQFGDATAEAVDAEAARHEGFETSFAYQNAVGALDTVANGVTKSADFDPTGSSFPVDDNKSVIYKIFNAVKNVGDIFMGVQMLIPGSPANIIYLGTGLDKDATITQVCKLINDSKGQAALLLFEFGVNIFAGVWSGGSSAAASAAARGATEEAVSIAFREGMKKVAYAVVLKETKSLALNVAAMKGFEVVLGFLMERTKGTDSSALDDGRTLAATEDMGNELSANDSGLASGGRPLTDTEEAQMSAYARTTRLAALHKKSLWYRIASLENPYSPVSRLAVSYPTNIPSLVNTTRDYAFKGLNPLSTFANSSSQIASATSISSKTVYAGKSSTEKYGFKKIAYSKAEMDKMLEPSFWPRANAEWIETGDRLKDLDEAVGYCYKPLTKVAIMPADCEGKLKNGADGFTADEVLRYRLYRGMEGGLGEDERKPIKTDQNQGVLGQLIDFQEVVDDSTVSSNTGDNTDIEIVSGDTSDLPCLAGTDLGPADGYKDGKLIKIKICDVQSIVVNSQVSKKVDDMITAARQVGIQLTGSGFRTMAKQRELYQKYLAGTGNVAAKPGYSNHQMGLAIDFNYSQLKVPLGTCQANPDGYPVYKWLASNAGYYGFSAKVSSECWHWSVGGH